MKGSSLHIDCNVVLLLLIADYIFFSDMEDIMVYTIQKSMFSQRKAIILFALLLRDRISKVWNDRFI
jgi:hypothetical protein